MLKRNSSWIRFAAFSCLAGAACFTGGTPSKAEDTFHNRFEAAVQEIWPGKQVKVDGPNSTAEGLILTDGTLRDGNRYYSLSIVHIPQDRRAEFAGMLAPMPTDIKIDVPGRENARFSDFIGSRIGPEGSDLYVEMITSFSCANGFEVEIDLYERFDPQGAADTGPGSAGWNLAHKQWEHLQIDAELLARKVSSALADHNVCDSQAGQGTPGGPVTAVAAEIVGDIEIIRPDGTRVPLVGGEKIGNDDIIYTGLGASMTVRYSSGVIVKVDELTDIKLKMLTDRGSDSIITRLLLRSGGLSVDTVHGTELKSDFDIVAPPVVCGIRGTKFSIQVKNGPEHVSITRTEEGSVWVAPLDASFEPMVVEAGGMLSVYDNRVEKSGAVRAATLEELPNGMLDARGEPFPEFPPRKAGSQPTVPVLEDTPFAALPPPSSVSGSGGARYFGETATTGLLEFSSLVPGDVRAKDPYGIVEVHGKLSGTVLEGRWVRYDGGASCGEYYKDSKNWGRVRFEFNGDYSAFSGKYGICEGTLDQPWNASAHDPWQASTESAPSGSSTWASGELGTFVFHSLSDGDVSADSDPAGIAMIYGQKHGNVLEGYWLRTDGATRCAGEYRGSKNWGRIRFTFDPAYKSFRGFYSACDAAANIPWNAMRAN